MLLAGLTYAILILLASLSPRWPRVLIGVLTALWIGGVLVAHSWFPPPNAEVRMMNDERIQHSSF